jgi:hypothetical protein
VCCSLDRLPEGVFSAGSVLSLLVIIEVMQLAWKGMLLISAIMYLLQLYFVSCCFRCNSCFVWLMLVHTRHLVIACYKRLRISLENSLMVTMGKQA